MTKLGFSFDAMSIEPSKGFPVLSPGEYRVAILNSEMRDTKNGSGKYLWLDMSVLDGPNQGQHLFDILNLVNPSETAVKIGFETLSAICRAVNVLNTDDASDLYNRSMIAKVIVKPAGPDKSGTHRDAKNEIKEYKAESGVPFKKFVQPQGNAAAPVSASAPWKR